MNYSYYNSKQLITAYTRDIAELKLKQNENENEKKIDTLILLAGSPVASPEKKKEYKHRLYTIMKRNEDVEEDIEFYRVALAEAVKCIKNRERVVRELSLYFRVLKNIK